MLIDANTLLYATDVGSPQPVAARWLEDALNGRQRIGIPWQSIGAFIRIATHPRIVTTPMSATSTVEVVEEWLAADPVWVPPATERTMRVLSGLLTSAGVTGNLITDAQLAAMAIEHGVAVVSADTDFARFPVTWLNPLTGRTH